MESIKTTIACLVSFLASAVTYKIIAEYLYIERGYFAIGGEGLLAIFIFAITLYIFYRCFNRNKKTV